MAYCARAQVVESGQVYGQFRDPTDAELVVAAVTAAVACYRIHRDCSPDSAWHRERYRYPAHPSLCRSLRRRASSAAAAWQPSSPISGAGSTETSPLPSGRSPPLGDRGRTSAARDGLIINV
jgi:hypothetical protein